MQKTGLPKLPKGFRDFSPKQTKKRNYIFVTLRKVFKLYGFEEITTPAIESLTTLSGKYGQEGEQLIFKVLNSGDYLSKVEDSTYKEKNSNALLSKISEKALRYDLTVPFARYVIQNKNDIQLPFKRFQIQPVWRADRPQKNRYREFTQCDCDIIGSESLMNEMELISLTNKAFSNLFAEKVPYTIEVNNFKLLRSIYDYTGLKNQFITFVTILDKIEKIGLEKVMSLLSDLGISKEKLTELNELMGFDENLEKRMLLLSDFLNKYKLNKEGLEEIKTLLEYCKSANQKNITFNYVLSRGLSYYTGTIFEVKVSNYPSICGGGRYDSLTSIFSDDKLSGVGISFGADRIYNIMEDYTLFDNIIDENKVTVLFLNFGAEEINCCIPLAEKLRAEKIATEIYPDNDKVKKQMKYANNVKAKYVVIIGSEELESKTLTIKNMLNGQQQRIKQNEMLSFINI